MNRSLARLRPFRVGDGGREWLGEARPVGPGTAGIIGRGQGAAVCVPDARVSEVHAVVLARGAGAVLQAACGMIYDANGISIGRGSERGVLTEGANFLLLKGPFGVGVHVESVNMGDLLEVTVDGHEAWIRLDSRDQLVVPHDGGPTEWLPRELPDLPRPRPHHRVFASEDRWYAALPGGPWEPLAAGRRLELGPAGMLATTRVVSTFVVSGTGQHEVRLLDKSGAHIGAVRDRVVWALFLRAAHELAGRASDGTTPAAGWTRSGVQKLLGSIFLVGGRGNSAFSTAAGEMAQLGGDGHARSIEAPYGGGLKLILAAGDTVSADLSALPSNAREALTEP